MSHGIEKAQQEQEQVAKAGAKRFQERTAALAPAEKKKRGLPEDPAQWTPEHDLVFFRRYRRMLLSVPPQALRRMGGYLAQMMESAQWPSPPPSPYPDASYPPVAGRLMTAVEELKAKAYAEAGQAQDARVPVYAGGDGRR